MGRDMGGNDGWTQMDMSSRRVKEGKRQRVEQGAVAVAVAGAGMDGDDGGREREQESKRAREQEKRESG